MSRAFYDSDLTDKEWQMIEPLLPAKKSVGRGREVDLRERVQCHLLSSRQRRKMAQLAQRFSSMANGV